jgi:hypothetical protein
MQKFANNSLRIAKSKESAQLNRTTINVKVQEQIAHRR